jgi:hypothetical protein
MARRYRETVRLPDDFDFRGVADVNSALQKKVRIRCQIVQIYTPDSTIRDSSFEAAVGSLEPSDEVRGVDMVVLTHRSDNLAIGFRWRCNGQSHFEVTGTAEPCVLGLAEAMRRFIKRRRDALTAGSRGTSSADEAADARTTARTQPRRLLSWLNDLSIEVVGVVLGAGVLALIGVFFTLFS